MREANTLIAYDFGKYDMTALLSGFGLGVRGTYLQRRRRRVHEIKTEKFCSKISNYFDPRG